MAAMNSRKLIMKKLVSKLANQYPNIKFIPGDVFKWSTHEQSIYYKDSSLLPDIWSMFHELGHALLDHKRFTNDIDLVQKEVAAWAQARAMIVSFGYSLDGFSEYAEDCVDTYRDWLHKRSRCPVCFAQGIQLDQGHLSCINCSERWQVSTLQLCRPYRRLTPRAD